MTENKRFRISQGYTDRFCHDWQNNQLLNFRETVELLNELNDECEFLKIDNESLEDGATKYAELYHKSLKENKQLKEENKVLKVTIGEMEDYLARMEEENKELKSLCKVLIKHIEKKSIAFVIDEDIRRLLE